MAVRLRIEADVDMAESPAARHLAVPMRAALSEATHLHPGNIEIHAIRVTAVDLDPGYAGGLA